MHHSPAEVLQVRLSGVDYRGNIVDLNMASKIITAASGGAATSDEQIARIASLDLNNPSFDVPVPLEYDPATFKSKSQQAQKGNAHDIARIKLALTILQKAYSTDYTQLAETLAQNLSKKVADDIITLLKGGVLNPLLSPMITQAAQSGLNKVANIIENITGSVLDSAGIYSEKTPQGAGDEPPNLRDNLQSLFKPKTLPITEEYQEQINLQDQQSPEHAEPPQGQNESGNIEANTSN